MPPRTHTVLVLGLDPAVCTALEGAGIQCLRYEDPLRALARLAQDDVDLLVTLQDLPRLTGEGVVVSARVRGRPLPAVVIGAPGPTLARVHRLPAGARPQEIAAVVRRHLSPSTGPRVQR